MKMNFYLGAALTLALTVCSTPVFAAPDKKDEPLLPKTGVLSSTIRGGQRNTVVDTSDETAQGGKVATSPVAGSVSRISPKEWKLVVANNSEDPYSVDVTVEQIGNRGDVVKRDHFSYTLRAGQQTDRVISAAFNAVQSQLKLTRWANLAPKKKEVVPAATDGAAPTTIK